MREAVGIDATKGYLTHEAAEWHPYHQRWYFFPRKVSFEPFDETIDERERGGNTLIIADETYELRASRSQLSLRFLTLLCP